MCGIAGYFGRYNLEQFTLDTVLGSMYSRGPNCHGVIRKNICGKNLCLLHSRLSIIDLDARSNQPFQIGNYFLIFNGEIYNYLELRKELENDGCAFHTNSDTEVLLTSYIRYGKKCVGKFEGMWAFAILDAEKNELFLSRDRFGEKPLYYYSDQNGFYFGSEVKFIRNLIQKKLEINYNHILRYLIYGYKSLYKTEDKFFNDIYELPAAKNLSISLEQNEFPAKLRIQKYWEPDISGSASGEIAGDKKVSLQEITGVVREKLLDSVRIRLRSDVPLAFCLSGGVDSSALASIAVKCFNSKITTFSIIDSDERYNEKDNIDETVADIGCTNHQILLSPRPDLNRLRELIRYHDSPIATITYYVHSMLAEAISNSGFRVAFSGTAADEFFTGYYDHFLLHLFEMRKHPDYQSYLSDWQKNILPKVRNPFFQNPELYFENPNFRDHIFDGCNEILEYFDFQNELLSEYKIPLEFSENSYCKSLLRNRMLNELFVETTPVVLHEEDLNSMKYSVENRSPYLDSRLFSYMFSVSPEFLIRDGYAKYILRESVKGILNDKVRLDRRKKGFNASINSIIDLKDKSFQEYLLKKDNPVFELLNTEKLTKLLDQDYYPNHLSKFVFNLLNARLFMDIFRV
ncbi:MAG: asparagine synthase (glutamine-hydrolyzing) [Candidatus Riflebacteria bacterium]|nr:asparagine synthase (glutamine-hydrolyzing) [Candidatus Riflebacteria bacterium]